MISYAFKNFACLSDVPRKSLAPVFIVEANVRPLDFTANVDLLCIKDLANLRDMNLQHPELIALLMAAEPKLKENEWILVEGLMSRPTTGIVGEKREDGGTQTADDACICIVERTQTLTEDQVVIAQESCLDVLRRHFDEHEKAELSMDDRAVSSRLPSSRSPDDELEDEESSELYPDSSGTRPKRMCFADRLKMALERGNTPEDDSSQGAHNFPEERPRHSFNNLTKKRQLLLSDEEHCSAFNSRSRTDDPSCFSDDSMYSFESLDVPYEMDSDFEEMQANLIKPLHEDELCHIRSYAITEDLRKMCLSDTYLDICMNLDKMTTKLPKHDRALKSCLNLPRLPLQNLKRQTSRKKESDTSKLPLWIINHSSEVDSKRFLVEWLAASIEDVPLVVYQSSNGGTMCTDVIAAICSWIEKQNWSTEELFNALATKGGRYSSTKQFI